MVEDQHRQPSVSTSERGKAITEDYAVELCQLTRLSFACAPVASGHANGARQMRPSLASVLVRSEKSKGAVQVTIYIKSTHYFALCIIEALTHSNVLGPMHTTLHAAPARSATVRLSASTKAECASAAAARGPVVQSHCAEACGSAPSCSTRCRAQHARSVHPLRSRRHSRIVAAAGAAGGGNGNGHSEVLSGEGGSSGGAGKARPWDLALPGDAAHMSNAAHMSIPCTMASSSNS